MNQSKTDLGIVNESQLLRFGITCSKSMLIDSSRWKRGGDAVVSRISAKRKKSKS
jgi:hypothetical protein